MATRRASLSLKGRGLALLAQRDHSRVELKRKLMPHASAELALAAAQGGERDGDLADDHAQTHANTHANTRGNAYALEAQRPTASEKVSAVLDWLQAHGYLSEERFAESRVHARAPKFGNLRIRHELSQHGVALTPEAAQRLRDTEFERAREVRLRKFGAAPATAAEQSRQARFLAGRGFSSDAVRQVMRQLGRAAGAATPTEANDD